MNTIDEILIKAINTRDTGRAPWDTDDCRDLRAALETEGYFIFKLIPTIDLPPKV